MTPADRKCRSWRSCWRPASPICARSRAPALRSKMRRGMVYARLAADADQFLTMAKFRALRLLWARIEQACGLTPKPLFIAADTAWRMLTQRDPYVNMLRATMATFSAGLGGANSHQRAAAYAGAGIARSVRAARGAQHPAGAAGGIQSRQSVRSRRRLRRHRDPDAAALRSGVVAVSGDREGRRRVRCPRAKPDPAQGRGDAGGARSQHRQAQGSADRRQRISQSARGSRRGAGREAGCACALWRSQIQIRRAAADAAGGAVRSACATARIKFSRTEARGPRSFSPISARPPTSPRARPLPRAFSRPAASRRSTPKDLPIRPALAAAFKASGAALACLCSSDKVYAAQAAAAAKALQAAGARHIYLAGRPGEQEAALRAAGVSDFIFAGGDALATLQEAYRLTE